MTLNELIEHLEKLPPANIVKHGFGEPMSYRGYYNDLAFEPASDVTIDSMIEHARSADGAVFNGYKGGEYRMDGGVDVYIAQYGECGEPITLAYILLWELEGEL